MSILLVSQQFSLGKHKVEAESITFPDSWLIEVVILSMINSCFSNAHLPVSETCLAEFVTTQQNKSYPGIILIIFSFTAVFPLSPFFMQVYGQIAGLGLTFAQSESSEFLVVFIGDKLELETLSWPSPTFWYLRSGINLRSEVSLLLWNST